MEQRGRAARFLSALNEMRLRPPSSSGLGHHPFKVAARVRIPLGVRTHNSPGPVVKSGVHAGLSSRRSRVQVPSGPLQGRREAALCAERVPVLGARHGRVAQLAEHTPEKRGVRGSTPRSTTEKAPGRSQICQGLRRVSDGRLADLSVICPHSRSPHGLSEGPDATVTPSNFTHVAPVADEPAWGRGREEQAGLDVRHRGRARGIAVVEEQEMAPNSVGPSARAPRPHGSPPAGRHRSVTTPDDTAAHGRTEVDSVFQVSAHRCSGCRSTSRAFFIVKPP